MEYSPIPAGPPSPPRPLPRPFAMPWGDGQIVEEVSVVRPHWEPTIQLMEYDDGSRALRFCYYQGPRFGRGPMIVEEEALEEFVQALAGAPRIKNLLRRLVGTD